MSANHTPEPWKTRPGVDLNTIEVYYDDSDGDDVRPLIAVVHGENCEQSQLEADAALIAAAPQLLEQARLLAQSLEYYIRADLKKGDEEGARLKTLTLNLCLWVIKKAEGR